MAKKIAKKASTYFAKINWGESYASFILGAIIVIVLGLVVANYFTRRGNQIDTGDQVGPAQQQTGQTKEYKVERGDSLSKISEKFYGKSDYWPELASANKIVNPNLILVDQTLNIPAKGDADKLKADLSATSYQVKEGDTLFTISERVYGDGSRWTVLAKANRTGRLPNGNSLIFAGSTLSIPR